ncbi:hypothetical protein MKJ04_10070 [Pontibacter sp. E15-1]|uniref:hypothetical protein n=1 Tax=Pontibacter sp. E15-1 TaxID=2919918 RepID=UPI001F4F40FD|nr:hypothetical protein [Pontibacter sp. E15-1]MCJ8165188.1 hypothetical protein [Pontibacter sp. E15-1]
MAQKAMTASNRAACNASQSVQQALDQQVQAWNKGDCRALIVFRFSNEPVRMLHLQAKREIDSDMTQLFLRVTAALLRERNTSRLFQGNHLRIRKAHLCSANDKFNIGSRVYAARTATCGLPPTYNV